MKKFICFLITLATIKSVIAKDTETERYKKMELQTLVICQGLAAMDFAKLAAGTHADYGLSSLTKGIAAGNYSNPKVGGCELMPGNFRNYDLLKKSGSKFKIERNKDLMYYLIRENTGGVNSVIVVFGKDL